MKVLVVDDHALVREGLRHALGPLDRDLTLIEAKSAAEAVEQATAHPDLALVLLDLHLPGADGFSVLDRLRHEFPVLPVIVLSGSDDRSDMLGAIERGALGYIPKSASSPVMLSAVRLVLSGGIYLPPEVLGPGAIHGGFMEDPDLPPRRPGKERVSPADLGLTERQVQVLALLIEGKPNKLISRELGMAEGTVKIHVTAVFKALKVNNRTQAVVAAANLGFVPGPQGSNGSGKD